MPRRPLNVHTVRDMCQPPSVMGTTEKGLYVVPPGTPGASPLLSVAIGRAGIAKGVRACTFLATWAIAERKLGHKLGAADGGTVTAGVREHAKYWALSERTSWRDVAAWQKAFPTESSPAALAGQFLRVYDVELAKRADALGQVTGVMVLVG